MYVCMYLSSDAAVLLRSRAFVFTSEAVEMYSSCWYSSLRRIASVVSQINTQPTYHTEAQSLLTVADK